MNTEAEEVEGNPATLRGLCDRMKYLPTSTLHVDVVFHSTDCGKGLTLAPLKYSYMKNTEKLVFHQSFLMCIGSVLLSSLQKSINHSIIPLHHFDGLQLIIIFTRYSKVILRKKLVTSNCRRYLQIT